MSLVQLAIVGSGNIGTDLMVKVIQRSKSLKLAALVGIDPASDGLARARKFGITALHTGLNGLVEHPLWADIDIVCDATSAGAHRHHHDIVTTAGKTIIDLTPAALGPYVVPSVNGDLNLDRDNLNMVTCGGQATIPIVAAVSQVANVHYAEIIASISSRSAGPGTRANIDEFTATTAAGLERVGGAKKGKAIIILNPAEPPMIMRDTVITLSDTVDTALIDESVSNMVSRVQKFVPGYRLKQAVQYKHFGANNPISIPGYGEFVGIKTSVFLEVEGAGDYLPAYAGNLDIMTSAALATAEQIAERRFTQRQTGT
ncbi:MAG: acetaldehyde dehydrogenase (acetylating) [Pseudomonadota bacterium]